LLTRAGIGVPHEYLNPVNASSIRQRAATDVRALTQRDYLTWLDTHRTTPNGVFATKVHWAQLANNPGAVQHWFTGGPTPTLVFLHRRGLSAQAHSLQDAARTGVWDTSGQTSTTPPTGLRRIGFDDIDRLTYRIVYWNSMWRLFFEAGQWETVDIAYEDLVKDQPGHVTRIADALNVTCDLPQPEPPPPSRSHRSDQRHEQVIRYAQSWVVPAATRGESTRRFARAIGIDMMRSLARRGWRGSSNDVEENAGL
jgi:LPS sulfotransferase NodH